MAKVITATGRISATILAGAVVTDATIPATDGVGESGSYSITDSFGYGTGAAKINAQYQKVTTIAYNANTTLDLTSLTDNQGNAIDFASVKLLVVQNTGPGTNTLIVGGGTTPFVAALPNIPAGGSIVIDVGVLAATGISTTTANNLKLTSGAEDITSAVVINVIALGLHA
jgi:hypothetical protein